MDSTACFDREEATTFAPADARPRAMALPMPEVPPTTTAHFPARLNIGTDGLPRSPFGSYQDIRTFTTIKSRCHGDLVLLAVSWRGYFLLLAYFQMLTGSGPFEFCARGRESS